MDLATSLQNKTEEQLKLAKEIKDRLAMERLFPFVKDLGTVSSHIESTDYDYGLLREAAMFIADKRVPPERMLDALDHSRFKIFEVRESGKVLMFYESVSQLTVEQFLFVTRNMRRK